MQTSIAIAAAAVILATFISPARRQARRTADLFGLWAYLAVMNRGWPDRHILGASSTQQSREDFATRYPKTMERAVLAGAQSPTT